MKENYGSRIIEIAYVKILNVAYVRATKEDGSIYFLPESEVCVAVYL
jgi:hypothetical protein